MVEVQYTCATCGQTFDSEEALSDHMITNHATKQEITEEGEEK
jgi:hypothetical protein